MKSNLHNYDSYDTDGGDDDINRDTSVLKQHEIYTTNDRKYNNDNSSDDDNDDQEGHNSDGVNDSTMSYESTAAEELEANKQHTIPYSTSNKTTASNNNNNNNNNKVIQPTIVTHTTTTDGVYASATRNNNNNIDCVERDSSNNNSSSIEDKVLYTCLGQFLRPLTQTFDRYCRGRKLPRITAAEMRGMYIE